MVNIEELGDESELNFTARGAKELSDNCEEEFDCHVSLCRALLLQLPRGALLWTTFDGRRSQPSLLIGDGMENISE